jgi:hypothetical protein
LFLNDCRALENMHALWHGQTRKVKARSQIHKKESTCGSDWPRVGCRASYHNGKWHTGFLSFSEIVRDTVTDFIRDQQEDYPEQRGPLDDNVD